jgi:hypothetical protein
MDGRNLLDHRLQFMGLPGSIIVPPNTLRHTKSSRCIAVCAESCRNMMDEDKAGLGDSPPSN